MRRGAFLSGHRSVSFADPVRRALRQAGLVAPIAEPVAEPLDRERHALVGNEVGEVTRWARINDGLQLGKDGDLQINRMAVAVLVGAWSGALGKRGEGKTECVR